MAIKYDNKKSLYSLRYYYYVVKLNKYIISYI